MGPRAESQKRKRRGPDPPPSFPTVEAETVFSSNAAAQTGEKNLDGTLFPWRRGLFEDGEMFPSMLFLGDARKPKKPLFSKFRTFLRPVTFC